MWTTFKEGIKEIAQDRLNWAYLVAIILLLWILL